MSPRHAQRAEARPSASTDYDGVLITNARLFTGAAELSAPSNVLVIGNEIREVSSRPIVEHDVGKILTVDAGGRTVMPGLIDAHWHAILARPTALQVLSADVGYINLVAGAEATATLMRGLTTVRDIGGPSFSLKRAIDEGIVIGPRIYPSGAMITTTGGHGDFRQLFELPKSIGGPPSRVEQIGGAAIADSPDEVRLRVREQLMQGASQIKLTAGGGVASPHSPLDVATFTEEELRAAVEAAESWGTYVAVHAYTSIAIRRAIAAGVKCIEHGHLMDEPTAKLIAEHDVWLSMQVFLDDEDVPPLPEGSPERAKFMDVVAGTDNVYKFARKYHIKTALGTDLLFSKDLAARQTAQLPKLARWFANAEILNQATSINAQLLALSGPRNPYPGKLGVIETGALADLLIIDGDPLEKIQLMADPDRNFVLIMKNGKVYKNRLLQ